MNKIIRTLFILLIAISCFAFSTADAGKVKLTCDYTNCESTKILFLYQFDGMTFQKKQSAKPQEDGTFVFEIPKSTNTFYYVGTAPNRVKSVIIGEAEEVLMTGNCKVARGARAQDEVNKVYTEAMDFNQKLRTQQEGLDKKFAGTRNDKTAQQQILMKMKEVDQKKKELLEKLLKENEYVGKLIALYTYYSYPNNKGESKNEIEYFANNYFAQADLTDKIYERLPLVFDSYNKFAKILSNGGRIPKEVLKDVMDHVLKRAPQNTSTFQYALSGITMGLKTNNNPLFADYGQQYVDLYQETSHSAKELGKQIKLAKQLMPGAVAPDFKLATPEGEELAVSDFRGKVLLIDFWASWCGPCRRENPHVVKLYEKYKDKGFEVLGVSLDQHRDRWLQAIKKDGLEWAHISDLRGWSNQAAKMYSVSSIPHTVLLDQEGRIIASKLRSHTLEAKLKEIFGE